MVEKESEEKEEVSEDSSSDSFKLVLKSLKTNSDQDISEQGLDPRQDFQVHYEWSLPNNHSYKNGDTVTFDLPKQLVVIQELTGNLEGGHASYVLSKDGKPATVQTNDQQFTISLRNFSSLQTITYMTKLMKLHMIKHHLQTK